MTASPEDDQRAVERADSWQFLQLGLRLTTAWSMGGTGDTLVEQSAPALSPQEWRATRAPMLVVDASARPLTIVYWARGNPRVPVDLSDYQSQFKVRLTKYLSQCWQTHVYLRMCRRLG